MPYRILFVCLGNICRSPTAECIFRHHTLAAGLEHKLVIDSAGTGAWHIGHAPDARMAAAAQKSGYTLTGKARQVAKDDFYSFDLILPMDRSNHTSLLEQRPMDSQGEVRLFRDFDPQGSGLDTPDPYYSGAEAFDDVVRIVDRTALALLEHIRSRS